jgi:pimeloyl-ACP methyl ester carboxylesterase
MQGAFIGEPPYPEEGEVADWISGFLFSSRQLWEDSVTYDAYEVGLRAHVPVIVIQGSDDRFSPSDAAEQFVRDVVAPRKAFVPIEGGHFACYTNPEGFVAALEEHVLPLIA